MVEALVRSDATAVDEAVERRKQFIKSRKEQLPPTGGRLKAVYEFAREVIGQVGAHLDIGTYNGFALETLCSFADVVVSGDISDSRLKEARQRPEVNQLIWEGRVHLAQFDGHSLPVASSSVDSASIIEVYGAGYRNNGRQSPADILREVGRILRPNGKLIFTIKGRASYNFLRDAVTDDEMLEEIIGTSVDIHDLRPTLKGLFSTVDWYGQIVTKRVPGGTFIPGRLGLSRYGGIVWNDDALIPRPITDVYRDRPLYWVGVAQKAS